MSARPALCALLVKLKAAHVAYSDLRDTRARFCEARGVPCDFPPELQEGMDLVADAIVRIESEIRARTETLT